MNISQERQGDTLIVAAAGRVDGSNSQEFQQAIEG